MRRDLRRFHASLDTDGEGEVIDDLLGYRHRQNPKALMRTLPVRDHRPKDQPTVRHQHGPKKTSWMFEADQIRDDLAGKDDQIQIEAICQ